MVYKGTWMKVPYEREWEVIHFGRNVFMMSTLLSDQGVMVTCRIRGPCTVESESSHAMATQETRNILFIIFSL